MTQTREDVSKLPGFLWMSSERVAREGYDAVMAGKPVHVNGRVNQLLGLVARLLPDGLLMKLSRRQRVD